MQLWRSSTAVVRRPLVSKRSAGVGGGILGYHLNIDKAPTSDNRRLLKTIVKREWLKSEWFVEVVPC